MMHFNQNLENPLPLDAREEKFRQRALLSNSLPSALDIHRTARPLMELVCYAALIDKHGVESAAGNEKGKRNRKGI